jgi:hypothetical protein
MKTTLHHGTALHIINNNMALQDSSITPSLEIEDFTIINASMKTSQFYLH